MMRKLPGERSLSILLKGLERDTALQECLHHGPKVIYSGLLHYAREQKWKDGWAYHAFLEIYGIKPRP